MPILKGKDFKFWIFVDGIPIALCHATDCIIPLVTDEIETTGPNNGPFKTYRPSFHSYTIQVPALTVYTDDMNLIQLQKLQIARTVFNWQAGVYEDGGLQYKGSAFITQTNPTNQFRDASKFDVNMRGTGPMQIVEAPITKSVYLADSSGKRLAGCPNPYPVGVLWIDDTFIGVADTADDVISLFNQYSADNAGGYLMLIGYTGGCDFTMTEAYNSPIDTDYIHAVAGSGFALAGRVAGEVIGEDDSNHNVIGV